MNDLDDREALEHLRQAGWTAAEIERLRQFRRVYAGKGEWALRAYHRPAFVSFLLRLLQEGLPDPGFWW